MPKTDFYRLKSIRKYKLGAFPEDLRLLFNRRDAKELAKRGIVWNAGESPFKYGDNNHGKKHNQKIHGSQEGTSEARKVD